LPKPWTTTFMSSGFRPRRSIAPSVQKSPPRAVASSRPSDPPMVSGLPVTTPRTEWPLFIE
jgi:hypothetical protein